MKRHSTDTSASLTRSLLAYSTAAGAVVLGTHAVDGAIIYSGPLSIDFSSTPPHGLLTLEGSNPDLGFFGVNYGTYGGMLVMGSNDIAVDAVGSSPNALMLTTAAMIGAGNPQWVYFGFFHRFESASTFGAWKDDGDIGLFGFRFELENASASGLPAGSIVYGWGEVERLGQASGRLLGWAYDDSGAAIRAGAIGIIPEPGTVGLLALGAAGIASMRRRRKAAVAE